MNSKLLERLQIASCFVPINLSAGANAGDWVSMKNYRRMLVLLFKGAGTNGQDPTITLEQATAVAGTGAKALNFVDVYKKQGADLLTIAQWTKVTQASGNTFTHTDLAEQQAIIAIEIDTDMLDIGADFDCVRASINDPGTNSQIGGGLYIMGDPRMPDAPENMLGVITD